MSRILQVLAKNIKKVRQNRGLSQDKLSKLAGVTLYTISKIEMGSTLDPRIGTVKKIAGALKVRVDELLK